MYVKDKIDRKDEILLEKFRIAAEIQEKCNNLFWYRTTVFFGIIGALFIAYAVIATAVLPEVHKHDSLSLDVAPLIGVLVTFGVAGAFLSWFWLQMHKRATYRIITGFVPA